MKTKYENCISKEFQLDVAEITENKWQALILEKTLTIVVYSSREAWGESRLEKTTGWLAWKDPSVTSLIFHRMRGSTMSVPIGINFFASVVQKQLIKINFG